MSPRLPLAALALALAPGAHAVEASDWIGTRWQLNVESVLPLEVPLQAQTNQEFILKGIQIRSTVDCTEAEAQGKGLVVRCTFEEVAIQATPHGENPGDRELENSQIVIEDVVQRLTGSQLETTFNKKGKVTRVSVELPVGRNTRERQSREQIRQLATDLATGWSLQGNKDWSGTWQETNSPLFRAPGMPSAGGVNATVHVADSSSGRTVVQSQGSGLATAFYRPWEFEGASKVAQGRASDTPIEGGGSSIAGQPAVGGTKYNSGTVNGGATAVGSTPETVPYDVTMSSVAVVDDGMVVERVWSVAGAGTVSAVGSFQGVNLWYNGHIRKLAGDEKPDLGPTRLVHPPGVPVKDLPAWEPMSK